MTGASMVTDSKVNGSAPLGCTSSVRSPATAFLISAVICVSLKAVTLSVYFFRPSVRKTLGLAVPKPSPSMVSTEPTAAETIASAVWSSEDDTALMPAAARAERTATSARPAAREDREWRMVIGNSEGLCVPARLPPRGTRRKQTSASAADCQAGNGSTPSDPYNPPPFVARSLPGHCRRFGDCMFFCAPSRGTHSLPLRALVLLAALSACTSPPPRTPEGALLAPQPVTPVRLREPLVDIRHYDIAVDIDAA